MSGQAGRYTRSIGGMAGAMLVVVVVVVAFVVVRGSLRTDLAPGVAAVEYAGPARYAQEQAGFELLTPSSLPAGWRATSVRYTPGAEERWHLGLLTDEGRYVGVEQARASVETMVRTHVDEESVERGEPVDVAGRTWTTWHDEGGDLALVRADDEVTTLVVGHELSLEELSAFVASLR